MLYCSQAVQLFDEEQLADLLKISFAGNAQGGTTRLLCYGNGHFVQVLEGAAAVEDGFARIRRARPYHQGHVLSRGVGPARRFGDWRMAFRKSQPHDFYWLITFLVAHHRVLLRQLSVAEPPLASSLQSFSDTCAPTPGG